MKKYLVGLFLILFFTSIYSADYTGVNTATFLRLIPDAKSAALGRAFTGVADNGAAAFFNPAGLSYQDGLNLLFAHHILFEDIKKEFLSIKLNSTTSPLTVAISGMYINYGNLNKTTYLQPAGIGTFSANEGYIMLSLAQKIENNFSLGGNLKLLHRKIDDLDDEGIAGDLSILFRFPDNGIQIGAGVFNIGPKLSMYDRKESLPLMYRTGLGWKLLNDQLTFAFDLFKVKDEKLQLGLGVDFNFSKIIFLRCGYNSENDIGNGFAYGLGFKINELTLDYAYEPNDDVGDAHYFALAFNFGKPGAARGGAEKKSGCFGDQKSESEPEAAEFQPAEGAEYNLPAVQKESDIVKKFKLHTYFAKQFASQRNLEDALLEIKLANQLLWDKDNIKLEIILLLELEFYKEAIETFDKFVDKFPALRNEIDFGKYFLNK